jgi:hypothetical protein
MPPTYAQNKEHIYKWRYSNLANVQAINRKSNQKYRNWKKIQKVYLAILIDENI